MKRSFLLAIALLVTLPAYMAFIISRSKKSPESRLYKYYYPHIATFSVEPQVSVWLEQSDTNYIYCNRCDTTGIFVAGNLSLAKREIQRVAFTVQSEYMHYKLGLKEIGSVISEQNSFHISMYKQNKLWLTLGRQGKIVLENCELDTLFVDVKDFGRKDLEIIGDCIIKHIAIKSRNEMNSVFFTCGNNVAIESIEANNIEEDGMVFLVSADILAKMNFKLNGRQITTGKPDNDSARLTPNAG